MVDSDKQLLVPSEGTPSGDERWTIATHVAQQVCRRYPADVLAVGVCGPLAHSDEREGSDINIVIVTYRSGGGPAPTSREIDGWIVDLDVVGVDQYLRHARTLTTRWPITADQYLNTKPLVDERDCFNQVRDTHLGRLAEAGGREFSALAREAWCRASSSYRRAVRATEWFDTDGALLLLAQARIDASMVEGLLTRTYYRGTADAARRTGISALDLTELSERLRTQGTELANRGRPVSGTLADLFR